MNKSLELTGLKVAYSLVAVLGLVLLAASWEDMSWAASNCGVERWAVKTLADTEGPRIASLTPIPGEISALIKIMPPTTRDLRKASILRFPSETKAYKLDALILGFKRESDSDFHIVLADPKNQALTMIAEIPASGCVPAAYQAQFAALQGRFEKEFGPATASFKKIQPVHVSVTGVFFFDFKHGQTGVAANAAELHPLLDWQRQ